MVQPSLQLDFDLAKFRLQPFPVVSKNLNGAEKLES